LYVAHLSPHNKTKEVSMKKVFFVFILLFAVFLPLQAQDGGTDPMMQKWMEYMTPGPEQERMAKGVGEWRGDIKMWMAPDTEPTVSVGKAVSEMLLGGRYLQTKYLGDFNGMPMEGISLEAYDKGRKVFISTWIDNFGTGVMYLEGKYLNDTKQIEYTGMMYDPMAEKMVPARELVTPIDDDHSKMEMFTTDENGKEWRTMLIEYTRIK